jgi:hypothetical protein
MLLDDSTARRPFYESVAMSERHRTSSPKRKQQLTEARKHADHTRPYVINNALRFTFSILVTGDRFTRVEELFLWNNILPPHSKAFYTAQTELTTFIKAKCESECLHCREMMGPESILAFDGSWSHRRGAKECVVVVVEVHLRKIVDFEIVRKTKGNVPGDYEGSPNGMEVEALHRLIARWNGNPLVVGYVHDSDSKASKAIRDAGWRIDEYYDPNHISKSFDRKWLKGPHEHLKGLQMKIRKWFNFLSRSDFPPEQRIAFWMNTTQHFLGHHEACPSHKVSTWKLPPLTDNPIGVQELQQFLENTRGLITKCGHGLSTQICESFNSIKARFADKATSWKVSWDARTMCAILQKNNPELWKSELLVECHLAELNEPVTERLRKLQTDRLARAKSQRDGEALAKARKARSRGRTDQRKNTVGSADYRFAVSCPLAEDDDGSLPQTGEDRGTFQFPGSREHPPEAPPLSGLQRWEEAKMALSERPEEAQEKSTAAAIPRRKVLTPSWQGSVEAPGSTPRRKSKPRSALPPSSGVDWGLPQFPGLPPSFRPAFGFVQVPAVQPSPAFLGGFPPPPAVAFSPRSSRRSIPEPVSRIMHQVPFKFPATPPFPQDLPDGVRPPPRRTTESDEEDPSGETKAEENEASGVVFSAPITEENYAREEDLSNRLTLVVRGEQCSSHHTPAEWQFSRDGGLK